MADIFSNLYLACSVQYYENNYKASRLLTNYIIEKLINQAIEFGWSVAFPEWDEKVEDVADAVLKYGRLFTMQSILKSTEKNKLKIDLKRKMYG